MRPLSDQRRGTSRSSQRGFWLGRKGHVGFPEVKPQNHNREDTLKYVLGRELISEKKNKLQLNTARNEVINRQATLNQR